MSPEVPAVCSEGFSPACDSPHESGGKSEFFVIAVPFAARLRDNLKGCFGYRPMADVKWLQVGVAMGISLPLLLANETQAQDWCANEAIVRERLERAIEDSGQLDVFERCTYTAVPVLIAALKDKNPDIRWSAVNALGSIGAEANDAVPALIAALKDEDSDIRRSVVNALESIGAEAKAVVPALIAALKDKDPHVRTSAATVLGNIGAEAKEAVPTLIAALKDEDPYVRVRATFALGNIGAEAKEAVPTLIAALKDENPYVRANAIDALESIGAEAKAVVPALTVTLKDEDSDIRAKAIDALGSIGAEAKAVVPALIAILKDEDPDIRTRAAFALGNIGADAKEAVPTLIAALEDEDPYVRASATAALESIGAEAKEAVPALIAVLKDENSDIRRGAATALESIAAALYDAVETPEQLGQAEKIILTIRQAFKKTKFSKSHRQVDLLFNALKGKRSKVHREQQLSIIRNLWLSHLLIWALLIFAYPRSAKVQTLFFWNPWVRRIMGLWYIGLLLAWVPFLRAKLFAPFKETLLAEAELDRFDTQDYFDGSTVLLQAVEQTQPLAAAIPALKGQIVLEGESGLGKSMFLRSLARRSRRILVYLKASRCTGGVMAAIQAKLHGPAKDPKFLRDLIYSGAIDICIDGLNEVSADTRSQIASFVESYFKGNIIMTTQPLEWTPPATAKTYVLQPLKRSQIEAFLISRTLPESVSVSSYQQTCRAYLLQALDSERPPEVLQSAQRILSNPMDLTLVAQMLAAGEHPDLLSLRQQQYALMAAEYQQTCMKTFPLVAFSERVYRLRLGDETALAESVFPEELRCLGRHKMVLSRQGADGEGNPVAHWYFRHDKIMEFFIVQTFLGRDNPRAIDHIDDPRFRGVYFLLVNLMPLEAAMGLREELIQYAADTKDHTVSDTVVQLLRERSQAHAAMQRAAASSLT